MSKNRLESFSDGVFAVAITLLILTIHIPNVEAPNLVPSLLRMWPTLLIYVVSFVMVGTYWVAHHSMLHFIKAADRNLLYLNILLLLTVSIIPFPTALIGQYTHTHAAVILYAANLMLVNTSDTLLWLYATSRPALATAAVTPILRKRVAVLHMSPVVVYAAAAAVSFADFRISFVLLAAVPIFFIFPVPFISRMISDSPSK